MVTARLSRDLGWIRFVIVLSATGALVCSSGSDDVESPVENTVAPGTSDKPATGGGDADNDDQAESREPYLRVTSDMKNQSVISGGRLLLKCRVDGWPKDAITFTWYKNRRVLKQADDDYRVSINSKPTGSRLRITDLYSTDAGVYRCEASNGVRRVRTQSYVDVSFMLPPTKNPIDRPLPEGRCEEYRGNACKGFLRDDNIYVDPYLPQDEMETQIVQALEYLVNSKTGVTQQCKTFAFPAFCNFVFSPCRKAAPSGKRRGGGAKPIRLCRRDCDVMKYDVCGAEFQRSADDPYLRTIFEQTNCTELPRSECTNLELPSKDSICYNHTGVEYRGLASTGESGKFCRRWPPDMQDQYPELMGGHNYCRNPGQPMTSPWCFTDSTFLTREKCDVPQCGSAEKKRSGTDMVTIIVPSISIPFLLACVVMATCFCRRRNRHPGNRPSAAADRKQAGGAGFAPSTAGSATTAMTSSVAYRKLASKVVELSAASVHLIEEMGEGRFGAVYRANILPNPYFHTSAQVAVKSLRDGSSTPQVDEFEREISVFGELQHANVACLKAVVAPPTMRCMIFEHSCEGDLHEFVTRRSPVSDFSPPPSDRPVGIQQYDFVRMASQIASGMEYLTSKNFIHRDLAARNVLVCPNMDMKISNLAIVRDPHLSCYYRSPQGGQMLPIRWMAPESLQNWQFSDKSAVWSFGVLLWEIVSYGQQPYCGYSNHEVLEMISRRQLLTCPDQCPAKVYSLMHECWADQPAQRPSFKELLAKLQGWDCTTNTTRVTSQLAQGIHRQLTTIQPVPYTNYQPPPSSIGGSSGVTFSSNLPGHTSPAPTSHTGTTYPYPAGPYAQQQQQQPPAAYQQPAPQPAYNGAYQAPFPLVASNPHDFAGYPLAQRNRKSTSASSRASSRSSSSRDNQLSVRNLPPAYGDFHHHSLHHRLQPQPEAAAQYHHRPEAAGAQYAQQQRALSEVEEDDDDDDLEFETTDKLLGREDAAGAGRRAAKSCETSVSSVRATSCDSGLPVDDVAVGADAGSQKTPLVAPRVAVTRAHEFV